MSKKGHNALKTSLLYSKMYTVQRLGSSETWMLTVSNSEQECRKLRRAHPPTVSHAADGMSAECLAVDYKLWWPVACGLENDGISTYLEVAEFFWDPERSTHFGERSTHSPTQLSEQWI